jgi:hypothetical protein
VEAVKAQGLGQRQIGRGVLRVDFFIDSYPPSSSMGMRPIRLAASLRTLFSSVSA